MIFENLEFESHPAGMGGTQARHDFENGYGVSVIQTPFSYTNGDNEYEVAIMKDGHITYDTKLTEDVLGHQTVEDINNLLLEVERL